jgi:IclR family pca regulon transcriptional regulator
MIAGRRLSALTTSSGRAMIARLPDAERRKAIRTWPIVALTPKTTRDRSKIAAAIDDAAKHGYGLTQDESLLNEIGIAAPILGHDGRPIAAVQCSVSSLRWSLDKVKREIAPRLIEVANSFNPMKPG